MPAASQVVLQAGKVYRTAHLVPWGANPTRLASRLKQEGRLQRLGHGLFYAPTESRFGVVPPSNEALLDAYFDGTPWVETGPPRWNALGLGSTAMFAKTLVYNTKRTGTVKVGKRAFELRRVGFPVDPSPEWFVIDLLRNVDSVGLDIAEVEPRLAHAVEDGRFSRDTLVEMAARFGRRSEQDLVRRVLSGRTSS